MRMQIRNVKELSLQFVRLGTIIDYLKACHNLRSKTQKMQILAETTVTTFKKGK